MFVVVFYFGTYISWANIHFFSFSLLFSFLYFASIVPSFCDPPYFYFSFSYLQLDYFFLFLSPTSTSHPFFLHFPPPSFTSTFHSLLLPPRSLASTSHPLLLPYRKCLPFNFVRPLSFDIRYHDMR